MDETTKTSCFFLVCGLNQCCAFAMSNNKKMAKATMKLTVVPNDRVVY